MDPKGRMASLEERDARKDSRELIDIITTIIVFFGVIHYILYYTRNSYSYNKNYHRVSQSQASKGGETKER